MGKTVFDVADSITKKLVENENINIELEFENFNPLDGEIDFLCIEIQRRIREWYLGTITNYCEAELPAMKANMTFTSHAIEVFETADNICAAICSR